jgi:hypothetical protein
MDSVDVRQLLAVTYPSIGGVSDTERAVGFATLNFCTPQACFQTITKFDAGTLFAKKQLTKLCQAARL